MSRWNSRFYKNEPFWFTKEWWHNHWCAPCDIKDASGVYIWENFSFTPAGGREYVPKYPRSRFWNWWMAQP